MDLAYSTPLRRSRALAISVLLVTGLLSGLTSTDAHANPVVVEGTVEDCEVTIFEVGPVDLGSPTVDRSGSPMYEFQSDSAFSVTWATTGGQDCAGSLHAEHGGITKASSAVASAWLSISSDNFSGIQNQSINSGSTVEVATSESMRSGDSDTFGVKLMVAASEGAGTYSATLSFSVVME